MRFAWPVVLLVSCVHAPPERSATGWSVYTSAHFRVSTDLEPDAARTLVNNFERTRGVLCRWLGEGFDPGGREEIIAFARHQDLSRYAPYKMTGFVTDLARRRTMVMSVDTLGTSLVSEVQVHELTHQITLRYYLSMPRWFGEGIAIYTETLRSDPEMRTATLGLDSPDSRELMLRGRSVPLADLWTWPEAEDHSNIPQLYASSWRAVRCLPVLEPQRWADFTDAMIRGQDARRAWDRTLGQLPAAELETRLDQCVRREVTAHTLPVGEPGDVTVAPLSRADELLQQVHLTFAPPAPWSRAERRSRAQALIAQLLELEPDHAAARCFEANVFHPPLQALDALRELVKRRPDSGEAWSCLSTALTSAGVTGDEIDAAFAKAVALAPDDSQALNNAAWHWVKLGRNDDALKASTRAVALEPGVSAYLDTHAAALIAAGRCREAVETQRRAIELSDHGERSHLADFQQRLEAYERQCSGATLRGD